MPPPKVPDLDERVAEFLKVHQPSKELIYFELEAERIDLPPRYARPVGQSNSRLSLKRGSMFPGAELVVEKNGHLPQTDPARWKRPGTCSRATATPWCSVRTATT